MTVLIWKHGLSCDEVRQLMQARLAAAGISDKVSWSGNRFASSVGWGAILNLVGEIRPDAIVLEKCSGVMAGVVRGKCRDAFEEMFPGGEETAEVENSTQQAAK